MNERKRELESVRVLYMERVEREREPLLSLSLSLSSLSPLPLSLSPSPSLPLSLSLSLSPLHLVPSLKHTAHPILSPFTWRHSLQGAVLYLVWSKLRSLFLCSTAFSSPVASSTLLKCSKALSPSCAWEI